MLNGYKTTSKKLGIPVTTAELIILKSKVHRTGEGFTGCGLKKKTHDKMKRRTIQIVTKEPRTTSRD